MRISPQEINRKSRAFADRAKAERPSPPEIIQPLRAIRSLKASLIYRAITLAAASNYTYIPADLYDLNGDRIVSGDGHNIFAYCSIIGGGYLNTAVPRLSLGDEILVTKLPYKNGETLEYRWFCLSSFQRSQECT